MKNLKKNKGSALIIALLIMGILMTLALGLSNLVIREVGITRDIVNSGKAYFAAEAGIESAFLELHQNLPGYEQDSRFDEDDLKFDYEIKNRTNTIPYIDTEIINPAIVNADTEMTFNVLGRQESISIPLFVASDKGDPIDVTNFRVEYYIAQDAISPQFLQIKQEYLDMLRWKITGLKETEETRILTESIGDYLPTISGSSENAPTCFGTKGALEEFLYNGILYSKGICQRASHGRIYDYAREAYTYQVMPTDDGGFEYKTVAHSQEDNPMTITKFLEDHTHNYLTLTNVFNPSMLKGLSDLEKEKNARIYYRIIIPDEAEYTIREFAKITSTGYFGNLQKRIEAFISPDKFMPVFNFSLYRTDKTDVE